jgi:hypothetical protein
MTIFAIVLFPFTCTYLFAKRRIKPGDSYKQNDIQSIKFKTLSA